MTEISVTEKNRQLLLKLAKDSSEKEVRAVFREAAEKLRRLLYGWRPSEIKAKILELLNEYYTLEFADLVELTEIPANQLNPVIDKMLEGNVIEDVRRRRFQEVGKHYNRMFELKRT